MRKRKNYVLQNIIKFFLFNWEISIFGSLLIFLVGLGYLLDAEHARNIQKINVIKNFEHDGHTFLIRENYFIHHPSCKCLNKDLHLEKE